MTYWIHPLLLLLATSASQAGLPAPQIMELRPHVAAYRAVAEPGQDAAVAEGHALSFQLVNLCWLAEWSAGPGSMPVVADLHHDAEPATGLSREHLPLPTAPPAAQLLAQWRADALPIRAP